MDALTLLRLQIEWGADEALDDSPVDRLRPAPTLPAQAPRPAPPTAAPVATFVPAGNAAERALAAAGAADSLDALRAAITAFDGCGLRDTATNPVLPAGDPDATLLLIGDPPGADEDRTGLPFAGPGGALLDRMLASIGLQRAQLLLAPLIPWRPPGGRPPTPAEVTVCLPFLHRLITLAAPERIVLAGVLATRTLLPGKRRRPGSGWTELSVPGASAPIPALLLPSPSALATNAGLKRDAWTELRRLRRALDGRLADS